MTEQRITSRKNPLLQQMKKLLSSRKAREEAGLFAADGVKLLAEAVRWYPGLDTVILSDGVHADVPESVRLFRVPEDVMASISPMESPQGALFLCRLPEKKKIKEFSTGMKAKLKLLIALSHSTDLLLLDEPTAGLDVVARDELLDMLREYMEEDENRSILISSHISSDLEGFCDDVYLMNRGKIILHEDVDTLLEQYGILKVTTEQYDTLDKEYLLRVKKEDYGYACLTGQKDFYQENWPQIIVEKGTIDQIMTMMVEGK